MCKNGDHEDDDACEGDRVEGNDTVEALVVALEDVNVRELDEEGVDDGHDHDQSALDENGQSKEYGHGEKGKGGREGDVLGKGALAVLKVGLKGLHVQEGVGALRGGGVG